MFLCVSSTGGGENDCIRANGRAGAADGCRHRGADWPGRDGRLYPDADQDRRDERAQRAHQTSGRGVDRHHRRLPEAGGREEADARRGAGASQGSPSDAALQYQRLLLSLRFRRPRGDGCRQSEDRRRGHARQNRPKGLQIVGSDRCHRQGRQRLYRLLVPARRCDGSESEARLCGRYPGLEVDRRNGRLCGRRGCGGEAGGDPLRADLPADSGGGVGRRGYGRTQHHPPARRRSI